MTETLRTALHEHADAVDFAAPDLGAIHTAGDRTLRRRRGGLVAAGLVAAGLVVASTVAVTGDGSAADDRVVATDPGPQGGTRDVVWAEGSTLRRAAGDDIDLGRPAVALARTSRGYVFADAAGAVYSVVGAEVQQVGSTDPARIRLLSDPGDPRAVWVDVDGAGVVVHDLATGADLTILERFTDAEPVLTAMDGDTVYATVGGEARSLDIATGETVVLADDGSEVLDASDGVLALGSDSGIRLSGRGPDTELRESYGDMGVFSPDGAWFSSDADQPQVADTATGEQVAFEVPGYFATGYEWLDATTLVMISQADEQAPVALLTCRVPDGSCEVAAEVGPMDEVFEGGIVLPVGVPLD